MIKVLEQAIEKVRALPKERQQYVAHVIEQIVETGGEESRLTDDEERLVQEGIAAADRSEFAAEGEVEALLNRYRA